MVCGSGAAANYRTRGGSHQKFENQYASNPELFVEVSFYPEVEDPEAPDHLPPNVRAFFLEAAANVKSGPNAAGAMLRKSIDVSLKVVAPDAKGTLFSRIDQAAKQNIITKELAEWAHHVRLGGNDAAQDEDPITPEEAQQLYKFTELLLMYLFTLPGMLTEQRKETGSHPQ
jgi:hypothetical protein